jgi:hypothetical protein
VGKSYGKKLDGIDTETEETIVSKAMRKSEKERRELAQAHAGEIVEGSGSLGTPRLMSHMVSLRLDGNLVIQLRNAAERRGVSLSDILREGAGLVMQAERAAAKSQADYRIERIDGAEPRIASEPDEHLLASAL